MTATAHTFSQLLAQLEDGDLHDALSHAVPDLIADLEDCRIEQGGKPAGKIVITIDFEDDAGTIEAKSKFEVTKPKRKRRRSIFYPTKDHFLTRENPRQQRLPFEDVNRPRGAAADVPA